jgi:hypothetical protein
MDIQRSALTKRKAARVTRLNLATGSVIVGWIAFACYAIPYLISH